MLSESSDESLRRVPPPSAPTAPAASTVETSDVRSCTVARLTAARCSPAVSAEPATQDRAATRAIPPGRRFLCISVGVGPPSRVAQYRWLRSSRCPPAAASYFTTNTSKMRRSLRRGRGGGVHAARGKGRASRQAAHERTAHNGVGRVRHLGSLTRSEKQWERNGRTRRCRGAPPRQARAEQSTVRPAQKNCRAIAGHSRSSAPLLSSAVLLMALGEARGALGCVG